MSERHPNPRQLEQLFQDMEDGCIDADDHRHLSQLLRSDPTIRRRFLDHMSFASALHAEAAAVVGIEGESPWQHALPTKRRDMVHAIIWAAAAVFILALGARLVEVRKPTPPALATGPGTEWSYLSGGLEKSDFAPDTRIDIRKGTLEITTPTGTRMLLEGPSTLTWHKKGSTSLSSGQAWVAVAKGDEGFSVRLPRIKVTDLGTEFGVSTTPDHDEVHVAVGRVKVDPKFREIRGRELTTGEAITTDAVGRISEIPCDSSRFVRNLPAGPIHIRWSFDGLENGSFPAAANGLPAMPLVPSGGPSMKVPQLVPGPFGAAYDLAASQHGAVSQFAGLAGTSPRTVALWIRGHDLPSATAPEGYVMNPSLLLWGSPGGGGNKWNLALHPDGKSIIIQWGGSWISSPLPDGGSVLDGKWHHIAAVFTGRHVDGAPEIDFYVDGEILPRGSGPAVTPVNTEISSPSARPLTIGLLDTYEAGKTIVMPLQMDELVITRQSLSADEIRRLMETNQLSGSAD
ncbi:MAG: FecR domain-containing protein [Akkermansiaceae bacterium]|nr:FecR domain-containing protein [Akkermansiaceae bacterium]